MSVHVDALVLAELMHAAASVAVGVAVLWGLTVCLRAGRPKGED